MSGLEWKSYLDGAVRRARGYGEPPEVNPSGTLVAVLPTRRAEAAVEERECLRVEALRDGAAKLDLVGATNLRSYAWLDDATLLSVRDHPGGMHVTATDVEDASTRAEAVVPAIRETRWQLRSTPDGRAILAWTWAGEGALQCHRLRGPSLELEASGTIPSARWELHPDGALLGGVGPAAGEREGGGSRSRFMVRSASPADDELPWEFPAGEGESILDWRWRGRSEVTVLLGRYGPENRARDVLTTVVRCAVVDLQRRAVTSEEFGVDRLVKLALSPFGDRVAVVEFAPGSPSNGAELRLWTRDVVGGKKRGGFRVHLRGAHRRGNRCLAWARDGRRFVCTLVDSEWTMIDTDLERGRVHHVESAAVPLHSSVDLRVHGTWAVERDLGGRVLQCTDLAALK